MKLWLKIFFSIIVVSLTTFILSATYLINKNHMSNVDREEERAINEYELIHLSLQRGIDLRNMSEDTMKVILKRYGDYYIRRDIYLALYIDNSPLFHNFDFVQSDYAQLLSLNFNQKMLQIIQNENHSFILVSGYLEENTDGILLYARDITAIYLARRQNIRLTIVIAIVLIFLLGFVSLLYSKWITKPITILHRGATAISGGDYSVRINEFKDEFNDLSQAFNHMASAIENRTQDLEDKARELQVFIDDLSHEMNTPLTSIQGYAEFLQNANASEEQINKAVYAIRSESKRMKDIYTKLMTLTFAREHSIELTKENVSDLIADITDTFTLTCNERSIKFLTEASIKTIWIDRTLMHMLLANLINNSIQAIHSDGTIWLRIYNKNQRTILEVTDNGPGIPSNLISEVIKPFYRVDKSRSRKTGGAGLGLSICKSIANLHHGEFIITSTPGQGTTVMLQLPEH